MSKKIIITLILSIFTTSVLIAQNSLLSIKPTDELRITSVGTPSKTIWIDGEYRIAKYRFKSTAKIKFNKDEYLVVTNCTSGQFGITISGNQLIDTKSSTINDFIKTRIAGQPKGRKGFAKFLEGVIWSMIEDTLYVSTSFLLDDNHFFIFTPIPGDRAYSVPYDYNTNELCITKDYLLQIGVDIYNNRRQLFRMEYVNGGNNREFISDNFEIEYIPKY